MMKITSLVLLLSTSLLSCDSGSSGDGLEASASASIPLLPPEFPLYPTVLTLDGFSDSVISWLDSNSVPSSLIPKSTIDGGVAKLETKLTEASSSILQPGVLGISVNNQFTALTKNIEVTKVGFSMEVTNKTADFNANPAQFVLYLGAKAQAEAFDESTAIPLAADDGDFIIKPDGEKSTISVENVPHLVDLLNNFLSGDGSLEVGLGYKSIYRMGDVDQGADLANASTVFGKCVAALAGVPDVPFVIEFDESKDCKSAAELSKWKLVIHKFELDVEVKADLFEVPEIPSCGDFATENELEILKTECPET